MQTRSTLEFVVLALLLLYAQISIADYVDAPTQSVFDVNGTQSVYAVNRTQPVYAVNRTNFRHLIVYSGPADPNSPKSDIYNYNMMFFLRYGTNCSHDTEGIYDIIFTLSETMNSTYANEMASLIAVSECNSIKVVIEDSHCYDMGNYRNVLGQINTSSYDYFVFINCGLVGPFYSPDMPIVKFWPLHFTDMLNNQVKLSGLSVNCDAPRNCKKFAHIQSMLWATDVVGLSAIQASGAFFDCSENWTALGQTSLTDRDRDVIIERYEIGISRAIASAGYAFRPINSKQKSLMYTSKNITARRRRRFNKRCVDVWGSDFKLDIFETLFLKSSRGTPLKVRKYEESIYTMVPSAVPSRMPSYTVPPTPETRVVYVNGETYGSIFPMIAVVLFIIMYILMTNSPRNKQLPLPSFDNLAGAVAGSSGVTRGMYNSPPKSSMSSRQNSTCALLGESNSPKRAMTSSRLSHVSSSDYLVGEGHCSLRSPALSRQVSCSNLVGEGYSPQGLASPSPGSPVRSPADCFL